jgi:hypothetical protein
MSPGHDPILGFIFGVIDILRGTMTVIDKNGILHVVKTGEGTFNLIEAFIKVFAHLLSDIFTKAGVQPPFFSLLQLLSGKSPFILRENGEKVSYTNVVRFMYKHGYDLRHFATMGIVPLTFELVVGTYYNLANFDAIYGGYKNPNHKYKLTSMLTIAHSLCMSGNILKMWMYGWNPLAFNYGEFLMLVKSFFSLYKSKIEKEDFIEKSLLKNWETIYEASCY